MKKIKTLLMILCATVTVVSAQIDLDIDDCPSPGLELNVTQYWSGPWNLNDSIDEGMSGANGVYDVSKVESFSGSSEVMEYFSPDQTQWANEHPTSNLASLLWLEVDSLTSDTVMIGYNYYNVTDNGCTELGISMLVDTGMIISGTPSGYLLETHVSYSPGGTHMNTDYQMGYTGVDSSYWYATIGALTHWENSVRYVNCDGYGQLTTPDGVVDVLRVKVTEHRTSVTEINGNVLENDADTAYYYEYWSEDVGHEIVKIEMDETWTNIYSVNYTTVTKAGNGYPTAIGEISNAEFNVYPNPAIETLNISIKHDISNVSVEMFNILGDKIASVTPVSSTTQVDVSGFQNGIYFINIQDNRGILRTEKVVINR